MLTFHNDLKLKEEFVNRMKAHIKADEVIQGTGFEKGRGCAVGCTYDQYDHSLGPQRLGLPEWYEHLRDKIFEGIPKEEAPQWALDSLQCVPVGVDIEPIKYKLAILRHKNQLVILKDNPNDYSRKCESAIRQVIAYLQNELDGNFASESAAYSAYSAYLAAESAESAAKSAAYSAYLAAESAYSAARSAESAAKSAAESAYSAYLAAESAESAYSAARSAESAAESAYSAARSAESAESAAKSAAESAYSAYLAAESAHWQWERDTLIKLLKDAECVDE